MSPLFGAVSSCIRAHACGQAIRTNPLDVMLSKSAASAFSDAYEKTDSSAEFILSVTKVLRMTL
jgi:hypothetical protein